MTMGEGDAAGLPAQHGLSERTGKMLALFSTLEDMELRGETAAWMARDLHLWPIVKYLSASLLMRHAGTPERLEAVLGTTKRHFSPARKLLSRFRRKSLTASSVARLFHIERGRSLFVGNATTFKPFGGPHVQLNYDPIRFAMAEAGHESSSVLSGLAEDDPRLRQGLLSHQSLQPALAHMRSRFSTNPRLLDGTSVHELTGLLAGLIGVGHQRRLAWHFSVQASLALSYADELEVALAMQPPPACYIYNYTSPLGWGLAAACARLGIPCFEIQHGIQSTRHGAYEWSNTPPGGWTTVPSRRLVWSNAERALAGNTADALVVGPGSLQSIAMVTSGRPGDRSAQAKAIGQRLLADAHPLWETLAREPRVRALFLSQFPSDVGLLRRLAQDERTAYLMRFHPSQSEVLRSADDAALLESAHARASSSLPLPLVMAAADVNVLHSSAAFIEGRYFGLRSVFLDDYAVLLRETYGDSGIVQSSATGVGVDLMKVDRVSTDPKNRLMEMVDGLPDLHQLVHSLPR